MRALRFEKTGDLARLKLADVPNPDAGEGEVVVRIEAAGLNNSDVSNVLGKHPYTTLPRIPGRDFAGVVVDGPADLVGRAVWGTGREFGFTRDGSHAQFICAPANGVAARPKSLTGAQAAACGVPYTTAWSALERCQVREGTRLLVIGAAGAVGTAALALGRLRRARVAGAVRNPEHAEALLKRGIPAVLLSEHRLAESAGTALEGEPEVILDTTGAMLPEAVHAIGPYGRVAIIVAHGDGTVALPARDLYRRAASLVGINSLLLSARECALVLTIIGRAFDAGRLAPPERLTEMPLEHGVQAYQELHRGARAKFVLVG